MVREDFKEAIVALLAAISIFIILMDYLPYVSETQLLISYVADFVIVVILGLDLYARARRTGNVIGYVARRWYEVLALIPAFAFVLLESQLYIGAALRSLRLLRVIRLVAAAPRVLRAYQLLVSVLRGSKLAYLTAFSALIISLGAVSVFVIEVDHPESRITNLSDAFWWALATVTTVGYGDVVPVTQEGRVLGTVLMLAGIATLSVFISTLGATLVENKIRHTATLGDEAKELIKRKIDELENLTQEELTLLINMIKSLHESRHGLSGKD